MKKNKERLPIFEVCGNSCNGIFQDGLIVKSVNFKKIENFLEKDEI